MTLNTKILSLALLVASGFSLAACSSRPVVRQVPGYNAYGTGVTVDDAKSSEPGKGVKLQGIPFYEPEPYLLVVYDEVSDPKKPKFTANVVYLPNYDRRYTINSSWSGGLQKLGVTLADGWRMTAVNSEGDAQIDEGISALAGLVGALIPGSSAELVPSVGEDATVEIFLFPLFDEKGNLNVIAEQQPLVAVRRPEPKPEPEPTTKK